MKKYNIIVDGSNGAFSRRSDQKKAKIENIMIIIDYLEMLKEKYAIEFEIITDANLKYRIDQKSELEKLYKTGKVIQCPSGIKADDFILEYFRRHPENTIILSNDNFSEYNDVHPTVCKFVIMFGEVIVKPDVSELLEVNEGIKEGGKADVQAV